ncbi:MAG TPA: ABC transporter substrate-binding protein, partial [bacterium]|nr:ABC transporter substrate-binding protein [bacterium]
MTTHRNATASAHGLRKASVWLGALLGVLALALGLGVQHAWAVTPAHGGTLLFTIPASDYPSMDGHQEETFATVQAFAPFYSLLIRVDPTDTKAERIQGDLATGWKVSNGGKTYTFPLHTGVTFHDGSPVTAKDVVASLEHFINPPAGVASPRKSYYTEVESVSAPNDHTVVIKLKFPTAAFIPALAQPYNFIYEAKLLAQDANYYKNHEMGSGPFVLKSQQIGANVVGERYPKYFRKGLPYLDGFEALYTPKENIEIEALRGGRSMIQFRGFPPAAVQELQKAMGDKLRVQQSPWNCSLYIIPNTFK